MMLRKTLPYAAALLALTVLLSPYAYGKKKKYDNPIKKDTQQPDKVLFDLAIQDIEHSRYEKARLLLQTMMNTYDNSEYLAKAKLAVPGAKSGWMTCSAIGAVARLKVLR